MAPEWTNIYGKRITRDVSTSLQYPDNWLVKAIFCVYENQNEDVSVNKGITITFWGDVVEQPIITAGKIVYTDISKGIIEIYGIYGFVGMMKMKIIAMNWMEELVIL
jgi:hypothetical protein